MDDLENVFSELPDDPNEACYALFSRVEQGVRGDDLEALTEACGVLSAFYQTSGLEIPNALTVGNSLTAIAALGQELSVHQIIERSQSRWRLQFEAYRLDALSRRELGVRGKAQQIIQQKLGEAVGYAVLTAEEKARCLEHLEKIREIVEDSKLDDRKKNNLFDHIATLSREISKNGTRTDRFFAFASDLIFLMNDMTRKAEPAIKELKEILKIVTRARARKEGNRLPASEEIMQLPSPSKPKER